MKLKANGLLVLLTIILISFNQTAKADIYKQALSNSARSETETKVDKKRKPDEVLRFFEIKSGMKVFDVFAGGGYYSEILSYVVGPKGSVTLYNNQPWDNYVNKAVAARLKDNRLPNVKNYVEKPEELTKHREKYDAAIFILGMHDLYYADPEVRWPEIDKMKFLKGIHSILKPGAVLGVIDANAVEGADNQLVGKKLHRVDPKVLIKDLVAAGFVFDSESNILRNKDDDLVSSVFEPKNKYNTDRSVLKFRKK